MFSTRLQHIDQIYTSIHPHSQSDDTPSMITHQKIWNIGAIQINGDTESQPPNQFNLHEWSTVIASSVLIAMCIISLFTVRFMNEMYRIMQILEFTRPFVSLSCFMSHLISRDRRMWITLHFVTLTRLYTWLLRLISDRSRNSSQRIWAVARISRNRCPFDLSIRD